MTELINADPASVVADTVRRTAAEREVVLYSEPLRGGQKALAAWEKNQQRAYERDRAAFKRLAKVVPTTAFGAIHLIDTFLEHSMGQDSHEAALEILENIRDYLHKAWAVELKARL